MILQPNVADMLDAMGFSAAEVAAAVQKFDVVEGKRLEMGEMLQLLQVMAMMACKPERLSVF